VGGEKGLEEVTAGSSALRWPYDGGNDVEQRSNREGVKRGIENSEVFYTKLTLDTNPTKLGEACRKSIPDLVSRRATFKQFRGGDTRGSQVGGSGCGPREHADVEGGRLRRKACCRGAGAEEAGGGRMRPKGRRGREVPLTSTSFPADPEEEKQK